MTVRAACRCWLSPSLLLATASTLVIAVAFVHDVAETMRRAGEVRHATSRARAELAADTAATMFAAGSLRAGQSVSVGGFTVVVQVRADDWLVNASGPEGGGEFVCTLLPGAASPAFASAATVADPALLTSLGAARVVEPSELPRLDDAALAHGVLADVVPGFRRDPGIALLHLDAGTDRDDFVWSAQANSPNVPGDLVVVPGNLWVEPGNEPLELHLARDLVVVVDGNLYLGRSLRVRGGGRLLLATTLDADCTAFADADGNGRWSNGEALRNGAAFRGPVEGGGAAYLGLRRSSRTVVLDAGLRLAGELHVLADVGVRGPLVLPFGVTSVGGEHAVQACGAFGFEVERERVPGFRTSGAPRPSLLRAAPPAGAKLAEQTLYPPPAAR